MIMWPTCRTHTLMVLPLIDRNGKSGAGMSVTVGSSDILKPAELMNGATCAERSAVSFRRQRGSSRLAIRPTTPPNYLTNGG